MKFLIYPASKQTRCKRKNRMTRIYLPDGTELKGVDSFEIVGREEVVSLTARPLAEGGPIIVRRLVADRLVITFKDPTFLTVDKRPKKARAS